MHNGRIADFVAVKRHLRHLLEDDIYNWIKGETDSEHFFALLIQNAQGRDLSKSDVVADTLRATIDDVNRLVKKYSKYQSSYFNFCFTDGKRLFASRYCSNKNMRPESLHQSVLIASEKLTKFHAEWQHVPANHLLIVEEDLSIRLELI